MAHRLTDLDQFRSDVRRCTRCHVVYLPAEPCCPACKNPEFSLEPKMIHAHNIAETYGNGIRVDAEFRDLIDSLTDEERAQLLANLMREGCRDPIVLWKGERIVVDGHNRIDICTEHEIPFETVELEFANRAAVIDWITRNQLGRRNLSPTRADYFRGKRLEHEQAARKGKANGKPAGKPAEPQIEAGAKAAPGKTNGKASERVARETGVSRATVERNGVFSRALDRLANYYQDLRKDVLANKRSCSQAAAKAVNALPAIKVDALARHLNKTPGMTVDRGLQDLGAHPAEKAATKKAAAKPSEPAAEVLTGPVVETVISRLSEISQTLHTANPMVRKSKPVMLAIARIVELVKFLSN